MYLYPVDLDSPVLGDEHQICLQIVLFLLLDFRTVFRKYNVDERLGVDCVWGKKKKEIRHLIFFFFCSVKKRIIREYYNKIFFDNILFKKNVTK